MAKLKEMRNVKTWLVLLVSVVLITLTAASPTYSWLSAQSERVVNTFAGGAISIILDESPVDTDGKVTVGSRVTSNNYKYVAGAVYDKDPTATVLKGSEECYVFLCLENDLTEKFSLDINTDEWKQVAVKDNITVYAYRTTVDAEDSDEDVVLPALFNHVTVADSLTAEDIESLGEKTLCVTAYAVQTESLTSAEAIDLAVAQFAEGAVPDYIEIA